MTQAFIERAEDARDLRNQLTAALSAEDESGIVFQEWSPGRKLVTIWNTETGEEATLPRYQAVAALNLPNSRQNGYMWTAYKDRAPQPRVNNTKCFLHPESAYRPFLDEIGITTVCTSEHLASEAAMWQVARNKHPTAFRAYTEETQRREQAARDERQMQMTEAMLKVADAAPKRGRAKDGEE